ncbi:MAG TPA: M48 family metallopeptidase [Azonexus sp.]|nr:M48 family metallopeptidase [Azonexus sp.]
MKRIIGIATGVFLVVGCATVAVTGRSQLSLITDEQIISAANQSYPKLMSSYTARNLVLRSGESATADETLQLVQRVSDKVIDASGLRSKANWQVTVVKSDVPNASVLPNGKIIVYTGLFPVTKTESGLAAVIGHEVAHVAARHTAERVSQVILADAVFKTVSAAAAAKNSKYRPAIDAAMGIGIRFGVLMPYSREHESEADRIGQIYMAKAGYDPAEAIAVWERMESHSGKSRLEFLSTHPANSTRIEQLNTWLPQARLFYDDRNRPLPKSLLEVEQARKELDKQASAFPVGLRPDIREDYWYKFKRSDAGSEVIIRYAKLYDCQAGKCVALIDEKNEKKIVTTDYRVLKTEKPDGTSVTFDPPLRNIRFPVTVGDEWEDSVSIQSSDGKKNVGKLRTRVQGYETVEVPAGNFLAYRVVSSTGGNTIFEGWYVPEARGFVKSVFRDSSGKMITSTMTDYQRSDDPAGALER